MKLFHINQPYFIVKMTVLLQNLPITFQHFKY